MIINLTQHEATQEQRAAGVEDLPMALRNELQFLLTFDELPSQQEIDNRAFDIAEMAAYNGLGGDEGDDPLPDQALIGGALWLMGPLAQELRFKGIQPMFAFSKRESVEQAKADGSVRKVATFRHVGFLPA